MTDKLQELGLRNTRTFTYHRNELIYIQDGKYYPTIAAGYKDAAKCDSMDEACAWINERKRGK